MNGLPLELLWVLAPLAPFAVAIGTGAAIGSVAARRSRRDRIGEVTPAEAAPRPAPAYVPADQITLDPRTCTVCGDPMPFGAAHVCRLGQDCRPERSVA